MHNNMPPDARITAQMELITHLNAELQPQMLEIKLEHEEDLHILRFIFRTRGGAAIFATFSLVVTII
jgi:hypothetical protein